MTWIKIAEAYETEHLLKEGDAKTIKIEGKRYCLAKHHGEYFAMQNNCPHAGASLGEGWCDKEGNIICPVHRIKFNVKTGANATGEGYFLKTFQVKNNEEGLFIGFEDKKWWQIF